MTSIEILSPSNKKIGNPGREKFLEKQRETLGSETHLVEIDLLRGGSHTLAVPKDLVTAKAGSFEYLVSIHRYDRPQEFSSIRSPFVSGSPRSLSPSRRATRM